MLTIVLNAGLADRHGVYMSWDAREAFKGALRAALLTAGVVIFFQGEGDGQYASDSGEVYREPSVSFTGGVRPEALPALRASLADVARAHGQEAVALIVGDVEFVRGIPAGE